MTNKHNFTVAFLLLFSTICIAGQAPTQLSIVRDTPDASQAGVGFMVSVELDFTGTVKPTGTVEITDGQSSCTITLPDDACLFRSQRFGETLDLVASYSGDMLHQASTSVVEKHNIAPEGFPERISVGDGGLLNGFSLSRVSMEAGGISADNRYVMFDSRERLIVDDTNREDDVYVLDRDNDTFELISKGFDGSAANDSSAPGDISNDGRYVVFLSRATNLVNATDDNDQDDVFLYDRQMNTTQRISQTAAGVVSDDENERPFISGNGQRIIFTSVAQNLSAEVDNNGEQLYMYDRSTDTLSLISKNSTNGDIANDDIGNYGISDDGNLVIFRTRANNLVANDTNNESDVFLYTHSTGTLVRINVDENGNELSQGSNSNALSGDGNFAFFTASDEILASDNNGVIDIFRLKLDDGTLQMVSTDSNGNDLDASSSDPSASFDGNFVSFETTATNADNLIDNNNARDVFVKNINTGELIRISKTLNGDVPENLQRNSTDAFISSDGQFVLFESQNSIVGLSNSFDQVYLTDIGNDEVIWVAPWKIGEQSAGSTDTSHGRLAINGNQAFFDNRAVNLTDDFIFSDFSSARSALFVRDRTNNSSEVIIKDINNEIPNRVVTNFDASEDGRYVVFETIADNMSSELPNPNQENIYLLDRNNNTITWLSRNTMDAEPSSRSLHPSISDDGRYIAWFSGANDIVTGDINNREDIFLYDQNDSSIRIISQNDMGIGGDEVSDMPHISDDGTFVFFQSRATNLVDDDTNGRLDIFSYNINTAEIKRISLADDESQSDQDSFLVHISSDGRFVLFSNSSDNLVTNDNNGQGDVFLRDTLMQTTTLVSQDTDGTQADNRSSGGCLSDDGQFALFVNRGIPVQIGNQNISYLRDTTNNITTVLPDGVFFYNGECFSSDGHLFYGYSSDDDVADGIDNHLFDAFLFINPLNNNAPNVTNDSYQILEGQSLSISSADNNDLLDNDSDADNDPLSIVDANLLTALNNLSGTLSVNNNGGFSFVPPEDENGTGIITYEVTDTVASSMADLNIEILPVNDEPSFTIANDTIDVASNAGKVNIANWASFDPGASNENDQLPTYIISNVSDPSQLLIQPLIDANGTLIFQFNNNANNPVTFDITLKDNGGTANGGVDTFSNVLSATLNYLDACIVNAPTVAILPQQATGGPGETLNFTVSVTNNNNAFCNDEVFDLSHALPAGFSAVFAQNNLTLASSAMAQTSIAVTSVVNSADDDYSFSVQANGRDSTLMGSDRAIYTVLDSNSLLIINTTGTGLGNVTADVSGIDCGHLGNDCQEQLAVDTVVTLSATAALGSELVGWSGDCSGTDVNTSVTMDVDKSCTAEFALQNFDLNISLNGNGSVTSMPAGIDCGADCSESAPFGSTFELQATPGMGHLFDGFTGDQDCVDGIVNILEDRNCTANFIVDPDLTICVPVMPTVAFNPLQQTGAPAEERIYTLTITNNNNEFCADETFQLDATFPIDFNGAISRDNPTITSGSSIITNIAVTSGANSLDGDYQFTVSALGASDGAIEGSNQGTYTVLDPDRLLTVSTIGTGLGTVSSDIAGINCGHLGIDCSENLPVDTQVTLTAESAIGSEFIAWGGDCSGMDNTLQITLSNNLNCTAEFNLQTYNLNIGVVGNGTIVSTPAGINCGVDCSESASFGSVFDLQATPGPGHLFDGFSGDQDCLDGSVTLLENRSCIANFIIDPDLTICVPSTPTVSINPQQQTGAPGETLTYAISVTNNNNEFCTDETFDLSSTLAAGFNAVFSNDRITLASGNTTGTNMNATSATNSSDGNFTIDVTVTGQNHSLSGNDDAIYAVFDPDRMLNVITIGNGLGNVTSNINGIDCGHLGNDCEEIFDVGTTVTLSANAAIGSSFQGWSGDCQGTVQETHLLLNEDSLCQAEFRLNTLLLEFTIVGNGRVVSDPVGIDCGIDCSESVPFGTRFIMQAIPDSGYIFDGYSGDQDCQDGEIDMLVNHSCTATFIEDPDLIFINGFE